jgi:SAM-dependent methyltransferase
MTRTQDKQAEDTLYEGGENLEVMREAVNYNRFLQNLVRRFAVDTTAVLDFGAGIGTFTDSLGIPRDRVACIEPDADAQNRLAGLGFEVHANLNSFVDERFTYIFTLNVLEHIEHDHIVVSELYRVLQPGGRIFVYVPAFNLLYSAMDAKVGHHRRYRMKDMTRLLQSAGFHIKERAYTDALGFFATLAYKVFDRQSDGILNMAVVRFYDRYLFPFSRILSLLLAKVLGKNLYVVAEKPMVARGATGGQWPE